MKKILIILSSHKEMLNTDSTTGVWLGEFTEPYYEFIEKGYTVELASPFGGEPPVDPISKLTEHITASNRKFLSDKKAQDAFKHTKMLSQCNGNDYDALFFPGGHGPVFDLAENVVSAQMIIDFIRAGKPVAAVCHGPAAFIKAAEMEPGLLKGTRVTGFSNTEEKMNLRADAVPFLLEDKLKELGADYHNAIIPFTPHVEVDGLFITGQNPLSAGPTAKSLIEVLEKTGPLVKA